MTKMMRQDLADAGQGLFVEKGILANLLEIVVRNILEEEVERFIGAGHYERSEKRRDYRNGTKPRTMKTCVGKLHFGVPQVRGGGFYPSIFERYQRSDKALVCALQEMVVQGVSTRKVTKVLEEMGGFEISAATVSRTMMELDEEIQSFRARPLNEHKYPYIMIDARYEKVRKDGRIVSQAVMIVVGINDEGYREVLGYYIGDSESGATWTEVFKDLKDRGLIGVELVISDAHKGIKAALSTMMQGVAWQRCRVHLLRELMNKVSWRDRKELAEDLRSIFASEEKKQCMNTAEDIAKKWEKKYPSVTRALLNGVENCLTVLSFPRSHRRHIHSTNLLERQMRMLKSRSRVVSIFPNESSCIRLIGALLIELNEKWITGKRYLNMEVR